jgi:hypothetical protein
MFRKIILKLLLRWYVSKLDEIKKLSLDEELKLYTFEKPEYVIELLKASMTAQTLWHFEAKTNDERMIAKGAALFIKNLLAGNKKAMEIMTVEPEEEKRLQAWRKFKQGNRIN